jgi:hypothetical protein
LEILLLDLYLVGQYLNTEIDDKKRKKEIADVFVVTIAEQHGFK